jgi:subtilisin family serine protease
MNILTGMLLAALTPAWAGASLDELDTNSARVDPEPGVLALRLGPNGDVAALAEMVGCRVDHRWGLHRTWTLACEGELRPTVQLLEDAPDVVHVAAAFLARLTETRPDDLRAGWWHLETVGAPEAWDITTGDPAVVVAVIDTGVRTDHLDIVGNLWSNPGETLCSDGVDDDGNGYVDDCVGWDVADQDGDVSPLQLPETSSYGYPCAPGHGTFIAGLVGETGDNGIGGVGVNWDVSVLPIKMVTDAGCGLTDLTIAEAILYAADAGADVINASWQFSTYSGAVEQALRDASQAGVITVIAAGNDEVDVDTTTTYPIWFGTPNSIVVAATTGQDEMASFSNWGATSVDIAAPGYNVRSLGIAHTASYETASGTWFSAPIVAGAAALVWSAWPALSANEVVDSLLDGAMVLPNLDCTAETRCVSTSGRLSLPGALAEAEAWGTRVSLALHAMEVNDTGTGDDAETWGDGDGVLELMETADLALSLDNVGHGTAGAVRATLVLDAEDVVVTDDTIDFGDVLGDTSGAESGGDVFAVTVDEACTSNQSVTATITLATSDGQTWTESMSLDVLCVVDEDEDGSLYPYDCDDSVDTTGPGFPESCNEVDDDCDGDVDEDAVDMTAYFADADGDGHGDPGVSLDGCSPPSGFVESADDCDDGRADVSPVATETCDGVDEDCDGEADNGLDCEADPTGGSSGDGGERDKGGCAVAPWRTAPALAGLGLLVVVGRRRRV